MLLPAAFCLYLVRCYQQAVVGPGEEPGSDTGSWVGSRQEAEEAVAHR